MPIITKLYSSKEVAEHTTREDCWLIVDGKVYDVTNYLNDHPGGDDVLLNSAGKDATEEFEDAGHSKTARDLMKDYVIGEVDHSPGIEELEIFRKDPPSIFEKPIQFWALPLAALGISVVAGLMILRRK